MIMKQSKRVKGIAYYPHFKDKSYLGLCLFFLWFALIIILIPLIFVVSSSFSSSSAVAAGKVILLPVDFTLVGYKAIFESPYIMTGFKNSVFYTVCGTAVNLFMTMIAAYPLSRKEVIGRRAIMFLYSFTMLFSGGLIPTYLVVRSLGMINTFWAILIPGAMSVWNMIIVRTYLQTNIPGELYESASLDGCGDIRFLLWIVIPLAEPVIAVMILLYAVGRWNAFYDALIYLNDRELMPLQIVLRNVLISQSMEDLQFDIAAQERTRNLKYLLQYSLIVVSSLPVMLLYPFIQKHFIKGIMIGAIKG